MFLKKWWSVFCTGHLSCLTGHKLIYLGKVDCGVLDLNAVPIGIYLYDRSGQLQVSLLIVPVVNYIGQQFIRQYDMDNDGTQRTKLEISTPKTKHSVRDIYMCESFAKEFYEYKQRIIEWKKQHRFAHSEEDFVFVGANNTPIEPRVFDRYYDEVLKTAGIENADFHTLRHTFTTRCIENGMDILMVAKTLGHANVAMTLNQYSHLLPKHMQSSMEKMEANYY